MNREEVNEVIRTVNIAAGRLKQLPVDVERTFRSFMMRIFKGEIDLEGMPLALRTEIMAIRGLDKLVNTDDPEVQENLSAIKQLRGIFGDAFDSMLEEKIKQKVTSKDLGVETQDIVDKLTAVAKSFDASGKYDVAKVQEYLSAINGQVGRFGIYEKMNVADAVKAEMGIVS